MTDKEFIRLAAKHPELYSRFREIIALTDSDRCSVTSADDLEDRVTEELRHSGREVIHDWAQTQATRDATHLQQQKPSIRKHEKKLMWHTSYGDVQVEEQMFYHP